MSIASIIVWICGYGCTREHGRCGWMHACIRMYILYSKAFYVHSKHSHSQAWANVYLIFDVVLWIFVGTCILFAHILIACHAYTCGRLWCTNNFVCVIWKHLIPRLLTHTFLLAAVKHLKKDNACTLCPNNVVCMNLKFVYFFPFSCTSIHTHMHIAHVYKFMFLRFAFARFLCAFIQKISFAVWCYGKYAIIVAVVVAVGGAVCAVTATQLKPFNASEWHAYEIPSHGYSYHAISNVWLIQSNGIAESRNGFGSSAYFAVDSPRECGKI